MNFVIKFAELVSMKETLKKNVHNKMYIYVLTQHTLFIYIFIFIRYLFIYFSFDFKYLESFSYKSLCIFTQAVCFPFIVNFV